MLKSLALSIYIFCLLLPSSAFSQFAPFIPGLSSGMTPQLTLIPRHAGKPDHRWRDFNWEYTDQSVREVQYRLYFYDEERWALRFLLPEINNQISDLIDLFEYQPKERFNYLLFTSTGEFRQANIFFIGEGVQGITSTQEATMALPYSGDLGAFHHISSHELVHQFQVQMITQLAESYSDQVMNAVPLWFIEGQAEYYSLGGMDKKSEHYIRDLLLHPDEENQMVIPKFFEPGVLNFISVYKIGQAKIDFLEQTYGHGTAIQVLKEAIQKLGQNTGFRSKSSQTFRSAVVAVVKEGHEQIQKHWEKYLETRFRTPSEKLSQDMDAYKPVKLAGKNLDAYDFSHNGDLLAIREVQPETGITSISLIDLKKNGQKQIVAQSFDRDITGLFFMEDITLSLNDRYIAYGINTPTGPLIEYREITRDDTDKVTLSEPYRIELARKDLTGLSSLSVNPHNDELAFVALEEKGWQNIFLKSLRSADSEIKKVTNDHYSWRDLSWASDSEHILLAASNRTEDQSFEVFSVNTKTNDTEQLTHSPGADNLSPSGDPNAFYFQSWQSGSSQIHISVHGVESKLTEAKTMLSMPRFANNILYGIGLKGGFLRLYEIPEETQLAARSPQSVSLENSVSQSPWQPLLLKSDEIDTKDYTPFTTKGYRMDNLGGFIGSGGVAGLIFSASDLMRDYQISGSYQSPGNSDLTNGDIAFTSRRGRSTWTIGAYRLVEPRIDNSSPFDNHMQSLFRHQEVGGLINWTYPLGAFSYFRLGVRLSQIHRDNYEFLEYRPIDSRSKANESLLAPSLAVGFDQIVYGQFTGPLDGESALFEVSTNYFPERDGTSQRLRLDLATYKNIRSTHVFALQSVFGASVGDDFRTPFYVSSSDILRAYPWGDTNLLGNYVAALKFEYRFPIGDYFKFPPLRGLAGVDYGTVTDNWQRAEESLSSSLSAGLTMNLPPFSIHFIWSVPQQVAERAEAQDRVFHFNLRYLYM